MNQQNNSGPISYYLFNFSVFIFCAKFSQELRSLNTAPHGVHRIVPRNYPPSKPLAFYMGTYILLFMADNYLLKPTLSVARNHIL